MGAGDLNQGPDSGSSLSEFITSPALYQCAMPAITRKKIGLNLEIWGLAGALLSILTGLRKFGRLFQQNTTFIRLFSENSRIYDTGRTKTTQLTALPLGCRWGRVEQSVAVEAAK